MSLQICVLSSGSTGNATAVWNETSGILIDCGRSRKFIEESLRSHGADLSRFSGILVTHGHGDHVGSPMISIAKAYRIPIFLHEETYRVVAVRRDCEHIEKLDRELVRHHADERFSVGEFSVQPFAIFHNGGFAGKPYGFSVTCGDNGSAKKIGFLTDTGKVDAAIVRHLADSDALVLEANHDPELVAASTRHWMNKKWVLSDHGHLSNEDHAATIVRIRQASRKKKTPQHVFLAHISQQHNTPEHALRQVRDRLAAASVDGITLLPTFHRRCSAVVEIE